MMWCTEFALGQKLNTDIANPVTSLLKNVFSTILTFSSRLAPTAHTKYKSADIQGNMQIQLTKKTLA